MLVKWRRCDKFRTDLCPQDDPSNIEAPFLICMTLFRIILLEKLSLRAASVLPLSPSPIVAALNGMAKDLV